MPLKPLFHKLKQVNNLSIIPFNFFQCLSGSTYRNIFWNRYFSYRYFSCKTTLKQILRPRLYYGSDCNYHFFTLEQQNHLHHNLKNKQSKYINVFIILCRYLNIFTNNYLDLLQTLLSFGSSSSTLKNTGEKDVFFPKYYVFCLIKENIHELLLKFALQFLLRILSMSCMWHCLKTSEWVFLFCSCFVFWRCHNSERIQSLNTSL